MKNMCKRHVFHIFAVIIVSLCLTGCIKNRFTIEVKLADNVNKTFTTLHYASDSKKGWVLETAVQVVNGQGKAELQTRNPSIVYIFNGTNTPVTFFYAERGDKIEITGKGQNPALWDISGNKINDQLTEWRKANSALLSKIRPGDKPAAEALNKAVEKYVLANSDNPVATLLLLEYFDRRTDESGFRKCWSKLHGKAKDGEWLDVVSRNDMLNIADSDALPKMLVLNTVETGCDTIRFGSVPVLLNFSRSNIESYRDDIKELRLVASESGDSASRVIANISLEPDSLMRWQNARSDSLSNVVQGWTPLGISDSQLHALGVTRIPYLIVVDGKGKVIYRGDDTKKAVQEFKKLING